jgi:hypothetical protein
MEGWLCPLLLFPEYFLSPQKSGGPFPEDADLIGLITSALGVTDVQESSAVVNVQDCDSHGNSSLD